MNRRFLRFELLEKRLPLDSAFADALGAAADEPTEVEYFPMIVGGQLPASPEDFPTAPPTTGYPATGSLLMQGRTGSFLCTGTLIQDPILFNGDEVTANRWVLTAGHCLDTSNNGKANFKAKDVIFFPDGDINSGIVADKLFINPDFEGTGERESMEEGCLSIEEIRAPVRRPSGIKGSLGRLDGSRIQIETDGLLARVLQHETDHLNGVLFIDRLRTATKVALRGKLKRLRAESG